MPRLYENNTAMGIGGLPGSINGATIPDSYGPYWLNRDEVVFAQPSNGFLVIYNHLSSSRSPVQPFDTWPPNEYRAGGNNWAAWANIPGMGLYSPIIHKPESGLYDVGPDGAVAYKPVYQGAGGCIVRELNGEEWRLANDNEIIYDLKLLGNRRAIWRDQFFKIKTFGIPQPVQIGNAYGPKAIEIDGEWFVFYWSEPVGSVLHPFNSTVGWAIVPPGIEAWAGDIVAFGNIIKSVWSAKAGEEPEDYRDKFTDTVNEPRKQLIPGISVPAINKRCFVTWFEFNQPPPTLPPGNALLAVRFDDHDSIKRFDGSKFSRYIELRDIEEIERISAAEPLPIVASNDTRNWPRWPNLKPNDWISVTLYCGKDEQLNQFETAARAVLNSIPSQYRQIAITCQAYKQTPVNGLTDDLIGIIPIYARLARDYPRVNMLLPFSDQNRAGGMNDNPDIRPYWQQLFDGVTGEPIMADEDNGIVNGVLVDPRKYFFSLVRDQDPANYLAVMRDIVGPAFYKYGQGQQNDSSCTQRGALYLTTDICPYAAPDPNIPLEVCRGVKQDPKCWEGEGLRVYVINHPPTQWIWQPSGALGMDRYVPVQVEQPEGPGIIVYHYTNPARRSDVKGMELDFEVASVNKVTYIEIAINDGDLPFVWELKPGTKDGRYFRGFNVKVTVEGDWTLTIKARDDKGGQSIKELPLKVVP